MGSLAVRYRAPSGAPLISVTQVLTVAGRINTTWFTPEAAERGRIVHDLTEAFDSGGPLHCPPELLGYLDAYAAFLSGVRPVYSASEVKVASEALGFAGRIDRVCADLFGQPGLLDFKTGDQYPWHGQQLAAYNALRPTGARWGCYLGSNGRFRLRQYDDPIDHRRFMFDLASARGMVTPDGDYWKPRAPA
jgi:hypothetical protein